MANLMAFAGKNYTQRHVQRRGIRDKCLRWWKTGGAFAPFKYEILNRMFLSLINKALIGPSYRGQIPPLLVCSAPRANIFLSQPSGLNLPLMKIFLLPPIPLQKLNFHLILDTPLILPIIPMIISRVKKKNTWKKSLFLHNISFFNSQFLYSIQYILD